MVADQLRRFNRWRRGLPEDTSYLVGRIVDEVVPVFLEQGYAWFGDYAGGSTFAVGPNCIPLQRRDRSEWPTVEFLFDKRRRPAFGVHFASLPEICARSAANGVKNIPRADANVVEGRAFFSLCKGERANFDCEFGYRWLALRPQYRLDRDVAVLKSLLPWLLGVLEAGIPEAWYAARPGYVDRHAFLSPASRIFRKT